MQFMDGIPYNSPIPLAGNRNVKQKFFTFRAIHMEDAMLCAIRGLKRRAWVALRSHTLMYGPNFHCAIIKKLTSKDHAGAEKFNRLGSGPQPSLGRVLRLWLRSLFYFWFWF